MSPAHEKQPARSTIPDITRHFSQNVNGSLSQPPDCLPFPAGPALPRASTHSQPLIPHGLSNLNRISLAFDLFPDSKGGQHHDKDYEGTLAGLHLLSVHDWLSNHGYVNQSFTRYGVTALIDAWKPLISQKPSESADNLRRRKNDRHEFMAERLIVKWERANSSKQDSPPEAPSGLDAATREFAIKAVRGFLEAHAGTPDLLLQRFWLKRLQVHLGFRWEAESAKPEKTALHPVHRAALYMLRHVVDPSMVGWAHRLGEPTLLATAPELPRAEAAIALKELQSGWTQRMRDSTAGTEVRLPACLCPFEPDLHLKWKEFAAARQQQRDEAQADEDDAAQAEDRNPRKVQIPPEPFAHWPAAHDGLYQAHDLWKALDRSPDELQVVEALAQHVAEAMRGPGVPRSAFAGPGYACDCTPPESGTPAAKHEPPNSESGHSIDAAIQASQFKGGPAALLLRFFLQQVLSHHCYSWTHSTPGKEVHFYFSAILGILGAIKKNRDTGDLAAFANLLRNIDDLRNALGTGTGEKWLKDLLQANRVNGQTLRHRLPSAFCPGQIGDPASHMSFVVTLKPLLKLPPHSLEAADRLAREIASLMTDPWLAARLPWAGREPFGPVMEDSLTAAERRQHFSKVLGRYAERLKSDARPNLVESLAPGTPIAPIIDRLRATHKYLSFTDDHWAKLRNRLSNEMAAS